VRKLEGHLKHQRMFGCGLKFVNSHTNRRPVWMDKLGTVMGRWNSGQPFEREENSFAARSLYSSIPYLTSSLGVCMWVLPVHFGT